jgi:hypothetical protein
VKVLTIIESPNYETLIVDELFSNLKSTKNDHQTWAKVENPCAPTMALASRGGSTSNTSPALFALSSLLSITKEQVESLGDEELVLVKFHNIRLNWWHCRSMDGCYNYSDLNHFIASCPKKDKTEAGQRDHYSSHHKGKRKYTSSKHKSKGRFDKESLKKMYSKSLRSRNVSPSPPSTISTMTPTTQLLP